MPQTFYDPCDHCGDLIPVRLWRSCPLAHPSCVICPRCLREAEKEGA